MLPILYYFAFHLCKEIMLPQLIFNNSYGQLRSINGYVNLPKYIGNGSDMILMAMGNEKSLYFVNIVL